MSNLISKTTYKFIQLLIGIKNFLLIKRFIISKIYLKRYYFKKFQTINFNKNKDFLFLSSTGSNWVLSLFDIFFAIYLKKIKKIEVSFFICDGSLSACMECSIQNSEKGFNLSDKLCHSCYKPYSKLLKYYNISFESFSNYGCTQNQKKILKRFIVNSSLNILKNKSFFKIHIHEHVLSTLYKHFNSPLVDLNDHKILNIYKSYFYSAIITLISFKKFLKVNNFKYFFMHHGIYIPQGLYADYLKTQNLKFMTWHTASNNKANGIIIGHNDSYHFDQSYSSEFNNLKDKLKSNFNIINILYEKRLNFLNNKKNINNLLNSSKPVISVFPNVYWEAFSHDKQDSDFSMIKWLESIIEFSKLNNSTIVIRIHPKENSNKINNNFDNLEDWIKSKTKDLCNIKIFDSLSNVDSYALSSISKLSLVYSSKLSFELPALNNNVIESGNSICNEVRINKKIKKSDALIKFLIKEINNNFEYKSDYELARKFNDYYYNHRIIKISFLKNNNFLLPYSYNPNILVDNLKDLHEYDKLYKKIISNQIF